MSRRSSFRFLICVVLAVVVAGAAALLSTSTPPARGAAPLAASAPSARAAEPPGCVGEPPGAHPPRRPGPRLRFGISPGVQTGQFGPIPASAKPDVPRRTIAALHRLRPRHARFVLRLTRLFWSDGQRGIRRFQALARRYGRAGFDVELQVRYHPPAGHDGDVAGFVAYVRRVVRSFAHNRHVVGMQVTNEVNFSASPDSSDGAYRNAEQALIRGVIAAKREARRVGDRRLAVGFNWFYRTDPASEQRFWSYLGTHGGRAFRGAVDWVGLDVYPGTVFPMAEPPGGYRDAVINSLSTLRCYMRLAGLRHRVPIRVEENGWPTDPPARPYAMQAAVLREMVHAFVDYRGTYNVSDYRWFDLRDADTSSPNFQQQYGLLRDDYRPKPAFGAYRTLIRRYGARARAHRPPRRHPPRFAG